MEMNKLTRKYDTNKLKDATTAEQYRITIGGCFAPLMDGTVDGATDVDELWAEIRDACHKTSENVLGRLKRGQRKEWLTEDTTTLAKERRELKPGKRKSAESTKHYNYLCKAADEERL